MKKSNAFKFTIISGIFVMIVGTLLHFTYEWTGNNKIVGLVSAVNESTWEHLKLLFFPMLLTTIIGYFVIGKEYQSFLFARAMGIITALLFTIIFFYTYSGVIGKNFAPVDIGIFFVAVILGEFISYKLLKQNQETNKTLPIIFLTILAICFMVFTSNPPEIKLFKDPTNGKYGIKK